MQCIQFTDDTTLYLDHSDPKILKTLVESNLCVLQDWFCANKLTLNVDKSVCLIFNECTCKNVNMNLTLSGQKIPIQKETKFLGVWLDKELKWDKHLTETINQVKM